MVMVLLFTLFPRYALTTALVAVEDEVAGGVVAVVAGATVRLVTELGTYPKEGNTMP